MRIGKSWSDWFLVGTLSIFPAFTNLKIGSLQPEDLILLLILALSLGKVILVGFKIELPKPLVGLLIGYAALLTFVSLFSFLSLRLPFYPLEAASILKTPIFYSSSRLLQFCAIICGFSWLTVVLSRDRGHLEMAMNLYWRTGILSALYAVISYAALRYGHVNLLGAYLTTAFRARGFFNEGGPFGLYIVTVFMVGILQRYLTGKPMGWVSCLTLAAALLLSRSKAAFFAVALLFLFSVLAAASFRRRLTALVLATSILASFAMLIHINRLIQGYIDSYQNLESRVAVLGNDSNLVLGRIAGAYIVPRMIAAHPITGIGIGNYPLMRNDPRYLGELPSIRYLEDQPGLGIVGYAAELGIPVTLLLVGLLLAPYRICKKSARILGIVALTQFTCHLLGAQLTFFYPWFVTACALAASRYTPSPEKARYRLRFVFHPAWNQAVDARLPEAQHETSA
jgi:hypothetical protein